MREYQRAQGVYLREWEEENVARTKKHEEWLNSYADCIRVSEANLEKRRADITMLEKMLITKREADESAAVECKTEAAAGAASGSGGGGTGGRVVASLIGRAFGDPWTGGC